MDVDGTALTLKSKYRPHLPEANNAVIPCILAPSRWVTSSSVLEPCFIERYPCLIWLNIASMNSDQSIIDNHSPRQKR
jgi:hypothetical protein